MLINSLVRQQSKILAISTGLIFAFLLLQSVFAQEEPAFYRYEPRDVTWMVRQSPDPANPSEVLVSWKFGPTEIHSFGNIYGDPVFYQLTTDYTIDLNHYLNNYSKNDFWGDQPDTLQIQRRRNEKLKGCGEPYTTTFRDILARDSFRWRDDHILPTGAPGHDLILIENGVMTIKKGYRWDGPSIDSPLKGLKVKKPGGGWEDLVKEGGRVFPKHSSLMRASLVHDAFYDLLREGEKPLNVVGSHARQDFRHMGDCFLYMLAMQDHAMETYTTFSYAVLQLFGKDKADGTIPGNENPAWKKHAIAVAGEDQQFACASSGVNESVTLDGSASPFATSYEWAIDGATVAVASANATTTVDLMPGRYIAKLTVNDGDDHAKHGLFRDSDEASIVVAEDSEPPIFRPMDDIRAYVSGGEKVQRVYFNAVADDNCGAPTVTCSEASGLWFTIGTTPVSCTAEDGNGKQTTINFNIIVNETQELKSAKGAGGVSSTSLAFLLLLLVFSCTKRLLLTQSRRSN